MPRKPTTPAQATARADAHVSAVERAAADISAILDGSWPGSDEAREVTIYEAAKVLESAGCYIRRANDNALLVPSLTTAPAR